MGKKDAKPPKPGKTSVAASTEANPKTAPAAANTTDALPEVTNLLVELEKEKAEKAELLLVIEGLQKANAEAETTQTTTKPQVEIKGKKYTCNTPKFIWENEVYTAAQLSENAELAAELLKIGSEHLTEIEEA